MVAGLLVISIIAGLGSAALALILGQSLWAVALTYMLGGVLGAGLGLIWGWLWGRVMHWRNRARSAAKGPDRQRY
jgi:hypothetical protein